MNQLNNINYMSSPYSISTLDDYILQYAESFRSQDVISKITQKWTPAIERHFDDINFNKEVKSNLAIYLEICSLFIQNNNNAGFSYNPSEEFNNIYEVIRNKIKNIKSGRSGVVRKIFNYETGFMEYELEDGNFIKINEAVTAPKTDVDNGIFPDVFLKIVDREKYRDSKIDEII